MNIENKNLFFNFKLTLYLIIPILQSVTLGVGVWVLPENGTETEWETNQSIRQELTNKVSSLNCCILCPFFISEEPKT